jgi:starch synthase (maltosyl-transferring)
VPPVVLESVSPSVDAGRFAAKAIVGDEVPVRVDAFTHGHDLVTGVLRSRRVGSLTWDEAPLVALGNDRFGATFRPDAVGPWEFTVAGWVDEVATWREGLRRWRAAGRATALDLEDGARLAAEAAKRASGRAAARLEAWAERLRGGRMPRDSALDGFVALARAYPAADLVTELGAVLPVWVDRERAAFSAWYELFPRSASPDPDRPGTLRDVAARLDYVAELGFDVVYLPPIHPIGTTNRKGPDNTPAAGPDDPGSPWAIGSAAGGHEAIDPALGTVDDFAALVARAADLGMEIALDLAFQCSPDHPWVHDHPEWFRHRADGSIRFAENPPKRYEDIYPIDFECDDRDALWSACAAVVDTWIDRGVRCFRVDNPHTKPYDFWEWLIGRTRARHPDVLFLSEAFTRPRVMHRLAKLGFTQSYTYFTWRTARWELEEYGRELTREPERWWFRPNLWPNTPDILAEQLREGGRPAFVARLVLAAFLSSSYGIYGPVFELGVHAPREPGTEEYAASEKYEVHHWDLDAPGSLRHLVALVNGIRREHPATRRNDHVAFHGTDNDAVVAWSRRTGDHDDVLLVVVNLDPHHARSAWVHLDLAELGVTGAGPFEVHDLLSGARYEWQGPDNFVVLDPAVVPAHVFAVRPAAGRP